jgi:hypothetical protein
MLFFGSNSRGCMAAIFASFSLLAAANAQMPQDQQQPQAQSQGAAQLPVAGAAEHPLMPALRWAREGLPMIERIQDYTATVIKKERIGSKLGDDQYMAIKVRHKPFSVYSIFLAPAAEKGKECLYVEGQNNGKMWAHGTGLQYKMFGTVALDPDGNVAMQNQRYPLTQIGILNLTRRLIDVASEDVKYGECEVKYFKGAKINDRTCTCIQAVHPVPRKNFLFNVARIFVDDASNIPVRYEAYDWPKTPGGQPELIEEYTYLNLKLNVGLTDADFDRNNPAYRLSK